MEALANLCTTVVGKVLLAIVVWFVGKFIVSKIMGLVGKIKVLEKVEPNTRTFVLSALKWLLYIVLVVSIVAILGVPMASVITVLGTAGAAIAQANVVSSLNDSGFALNPAIAETYASVIAATGAASDWDMAAAYAAVYPYWAGTFAEYGDAVLVALRACNDPAATHALQFDKVQLAMIDYAAEHFETVIVLLNNVSVMEMKALQDNEKIDAILSIA